MGRMRSSIRRKHCLAAVALLLLTAPVAVSQEVQNTQPLQRPLQMLVLGDSISWGQGLRTEHKAWHHVKVWLEKNTGRIVSERIEAHSGAVIKRSSPADTPVSTSAEVNLGLPATNDQIDHALRSYSNPADVELVLLSACGNDVGVRTLLDADNVGEVDKMTEAKCGKPVEDLLRRIATVFPSAHVIITGYYPFFSEQTRNDFVVKGFAQRFFKTQADGGSRMSSKEVFERLKLNSKQWYEASNNTLAEAARKINAELGQPRISFARIDFPAPYSFAAPQTHLWGFNRSLFRMALLFLSFGKASLPSNDEVHKERAAGCNEFYKAKPNETREEKTNRNILRMYCQYAALGHPNRKGALLYTDAIITTLKKSNSLSLGK